MSIQTTPGELDLFTPYVLSYNSTAKTLSLILEASNLGLIEVTGANDVVRLINAFYEQVSLELARTLWNLQTVNTGRTFPQFPGGATVEILEDYILTLVSPDHVCLATVVDPQSLFPFRYRRVTLVYTYAPNMPAAFAQKPLGGRNGGKVPSPPYPIPTIQWWSYPDLSVGLAKQYIAIGQWIASPIGHWRFGIAPQYAMLLANNPDCDPLHEDYLHVVEDIYDCFSVALPTDYFWFESWPFWLESKAYGSGFYDSYLELRTRNPDTPYIFAPAPDLDVRYLYWLGLSELLHYGVDWFGETRWQLYVEGRPQTVTDVYPKAPLASAAGGISGKGKINPTILLGSRMIENLLQTTWKKRRG